MNEPTADEHDDAIEIAAVDLGAVEIGAEGETIALDRLAADAFAVTRDDRSPLDEASRERATARALALRPRGSALGPAAPRRLADMHRQLAAETESFVAGLTASELVAVTRLGHDARTVLAHLVGQLDRLATLLDVAVTGPTTSAAGDGSEAPYDHWDVTAPHRARLAKVDAPNLAEALAEANRRIVTSLEHADGSLALGSRDDPTSLATSALGKTFELWMHADDVRLAVGRPLTVPEAGTVLALCRLATGLLPIGMASTRGSRPGRTIRVVLVGPGGGTWLCPGAPGHAVADEADALLVADAATFCRLFHGQVEAGSVPVAVEGDGDLVAAALAGAQAFAETS